MADTEGMGEWTEPSRVRLSGATLDHRALAARLAANGCEHVADVLREVVDAPAAPRRLTLPDDVLAPEPPMIVGVLNVTPDSFYDGGRHRSVADAVAHAVQMEREGAAIIEIGGEKAGPGEAVTEDEELRRVLPVIEGIRARSTLPISIDTRNPEVARRAVLAGSAIVNDVNGTRDGAMREVVAGSGAAVVVMHIQGEPRVHQPDPRYDSVISEVTDFLHERIETLKGDGVAPDRIIVDPGPGFGKTAGQDIDMLREWAQLRGFPQALMLAVSRKRVIGDTLAIALEDRLGPGLALTGFLMGAGVDLIRTHDVGETAKAVRLVWPLIAARTVG